MAIQYQIKFPFSIFLIALIFVSCSYGGPNGSGRTILFEEDYPIDSSCIENGLKSIKVVQGIEVKKSECSIGTEKGRWEFDCYIFSYRIAGNKYPRRFFLRKNLNDIKLTTQITSGITDYKIRSRELSDISFSKEEPSLCMVEKAISKSCNLSKYKKRETIDNKSNFCI